MITRAKNTQRGFMTQFLFAIALAITVGGGIYWYQISKKNPDGKKVTFAELVEPIVNTTLKYSSVVMAFQTIAGKNLFPGQVETNENNESYISFKYKANPKSNVTDGEVKVIRNNNAECLENPNERKENVHGINVGYMSSAGENGVEWERNYIRSFAKGNDFFCIEARLIGKNQMSTDNREEDEKQTAINKLELKTFEKYVQDMTDNFKIIIY